MKTDFTPEQRIAITTHDRNLVVVAGAGSGKTFVLVERFLALLDANPHLPLNAVTAITFTEKAAAEMRQRVREGIRQRSLTATTSDEAARWSGRLAAMDSARIGTIHSLCATILRANAAEAGVDPGFDVLDEIDSRLMLEAAIDDTLRQPDISVETLLAAYDGGAVRSVLSGLVTKHFDAPPPANDLIEIWWEEWDSAVASFGQQWQRSEAYAQWYGSIPNSDDVLAGLWRESVGLIDTINGDDTQARHDAFNRFGSLKVGNVGKKDVWGDADTVKVARRDLMSLRDQAKAAVEALGGVPDKRDFQAAELIQHWSAVATRAREHYRTLKAEQRALDFDDLERLTADLLPRPEVRARYAGKEIRYVLVDEFQDTNAAQWEIVRNLTEGQPGALFVVGDPKQSIYAFRGADVRVFKQVQQTILDGGGERVSLAESFRTHRPLVDGFNALFVRLLTPDSEYSVEFDMPMRAARSAPVELPSIEMICIERPPYGTKDEDEAGSREREASAIAARVKALVEDERRFVYDKRQRVNRPIEYGDIAILFQAMSNAPLYEEALKAAGVPYVTVAGKGFYDRQEIWDALNLLRAVYNPGDDLAVASALRSPFFALSDDGLLRMRVQPFRYEQGSDNGQPQPSVPSASGEGEQVSSVANVGTLPAWSVDGKPTFWQCLYGVDIDGWNDRDRAAVRFAREVLSKLRGLAGRITIADLLREAYALTGYLAVLTTLPGGVRLRANAEKLVAIADDSGRIALGAFIAYLDNLRAQEAREGEAALDAEGSVKLMTVHKSKGLEFPVVVTADSSYKFGMDRDRAAASYDEETGWSCRVYDEEEAKYADTFASRKRKAFNAQREDAEKRRLLYVAATRAADHLIISGQIKRGNNSISADGWLGWLIEALELDDLAPDENSRWTLDQQIAIAQHPYQSGERAVAADDAPMDWSVSGDSITVPPLIGAIKLEQRAVRDLTVTQIADLGAAKHARAEERKFFRERWERSVYGRAPAPIPTVSDARRRSERRIIGEIVHRAIQYGLNDEKGDLPKLLRGYAWEEGIVEDDEIAYIVNEAILLLQTVMTGEVFRWLDNPKPKQVFHELPFVYTTPDRTIHGIIDMLIERADGSWVVVDFKTAFVGNDATPERIEQHARRYHLQVGVYAAAVEELIGVLPEAMLDYIQHATLITVHEPVWRAALAELETTIGDLFGEHTA